MANGNVAPTRTIGGLASDLSGTYGLALDNDGNLYAGSFNKQKVVVFSRAPPAMRSRAACSRAAAARWARSTGSGWAATTASA